MTSLTKPNTEITGSCRITYLPSNYHNYNGLCDYVTVCCCSTAKSCPTLCNPIDCSMPGFPVLHYPPEFAQTHVHWDSDAIQSSHPLSPSSLPDLKLSQDQGLFQWVSSLHQVAKVLELQLQNQSFQWYSGLISFSIDCWSLCSPRDSQESTPAPQFESITTL